MNPLNLEDCYRKNHVPTVPTVPTRSINILYLVLFFPRKTFYIRYNRKPSWSWNSWNILSYGNIFYQGRTR